MPQSREDTIDLAWNESNFVEGGNFNFYNIAHIQLYLIGEIIRQLIFCLRSCVI